MDELTDALRRGIEKGAQKANNNESDELKSDFSEIKNTYGVPEEAAYLGYTKGVMPGSHYFQMPDGQYVNFPASLLGPREAPNPVDDVPWKMLEKSAQQQTPDHSTDEVAGGIVGGVTGGLAGALGGFTLEDKMYGPIGPGETGLKSLKRVGLKLPLVYAGAGLGTLAGQQLGSMAEPGISNALESITG